MATDRPSLAQVFQSRTMLVLAALGFAGGLPNLVATSVAPLWCADVKWGVDWVGLLALLQLPYALKVLWAPVVDRMRLPVLGRLGQRRSWLAASAVCMSVLLAVAAAVGPGDGSDAAHSLLFAVVLTCMVAFSATYDIVADAYRAESLAPTQLGAGAGVFVSGYRVAFVVVGAGILVLADHLGWNLALACAVPLCAAVLVAVWRAAEPVRAAPVGGGVAEEFAAPVRVFVQQWGARILLLLAFVLLFRLPDQLANAMTAPLLRNGLNYSVSDIGWTRQALGFACTIAGALAGGWLVARWGIMRSLWVFAVLQAASNAGFLLLAWAYGATVADSQAHGAVWALVPVIAVENVAGGMVAAGFVAYLMSVCSRAHVATQYALLTAIMAAGGALAGSVSGLLARQLDFTAFFAVSVAAGLPGIALIAFVRPPDLSSGAHAEATFTEPKPADSMVPAAGGVRTQPVGSTAGT
ncbi:MAG: MFS transporter [Phycisphaerales bacterium]